MMDMDTMANSGHETSIAINTMEWNGNSLNLIQFKTSIINWI